ncbi:amino acid/amide ABC transporter ATP-binding protein 2 (HAAT family) [Shimia isoporae]|uniref:Amino acid/amide ABC transporter ATP-binding protein 2 (HAAT family) n=1 Tax=Shimia isoporae TaxID=647720 RepID=A0A4R1NNU2_9RHOB|nr:ABC transporter ATP-binding protein [Shimia isoporae]TCL09489.1 amino acid/amide ABC transporter ATP-binding protein 2 (HAAT family) [Shimia isoporae]
MLRLENVRAGYDRVQVLRHVSLSVNAGEILCLMGRNGAGKTTTMRAIMGLVPVSGGKVFLRERVVSDLPAHEVPKLGIGYVPQGRRLFGELTVAQNLEIGLAARGSGTEVLEDIVTLFPRLKERYRQRAQTLSGGEQQMLATARALCLRPDVLLLDEPTEGLQPSMIDAIKDVTIEMRNRGVSVLLVEQRVDAVLEIADQVAFMEHGEVVLTMAAEHVVADRSAIKRHVGV